MYQDKSFFFLAFIFGFQKVLPVFFGGMLITVARVLFESSKRRRYFGVLEQSCTLALSPSSAKHIEQGQSLPLDDL